MIRQPLCLALALSLLAAPALAQEQTWSYRADTDPAQLTLTSPLGDGVLLAFTCLKDSRQIVAAFPVDRGLAVRQEAGGWVDDVGRPAPWPISVTLTSGEAQTTIPGEARPDPLAQGSIVTVEFADRAPVAEAFRDSGEIQLAALGEVVTPLPAPRRELRRFLGYCR